MQVAIKFFWAFCVVSFFSPHLLTATNGLPQKREPLFHKDGVLKFVSASGLALTEISFELANTSEKRNRGLMYRHTLQQNQGMLFVFDKPRLTSFYMKNTYLPLDIIFCDDQKKIVKIFEKTIPLSLTSLRSDDLVGFAVEVNAGFVERTGIKKGDSITYKLLSSGRA